MLIVSLKERQEGACQAHDRHQNEQHDESWCYWIQAPSFVMSLLRHDGLRLRLPKPYGVVLKDGYHREEDHGDDPHEGASKGQSLPEPGQNQENSYQHDCKDKGPDVVLPYVIREDSSLLQASTSIIHELVVFGYDCSETISQGGGFPSRHCTTSGVQPVKCRPSY